MIIDNQKSLEILLTSDIIEQAAKHSIFSLSIQAPVIRISNSATEKASQLNYYCINCMDVKDLFTTIQNAEKKASGALLVFFNVARKHFELIETCEKEYPKIFYVYDEDINGRKHNFHGSVRNPNLDLVLPGKYSATIFEESVLRILKTHLGSRESGHKESGYKIADSHFRIGSTLHISDFYYAKRFFQNSYYASKFAFLLAKNILEKHYNKMEVSDNGDLHISLIGYGLYSEILLSLTERLLQSANTRFKVNHDIISDESEHFRLKKNEVIHKNVITIVPIATTFGTSLKIAEVIQIGAPRCKIIEPQINILNIFDSQKRDEKGLTKGEKAFGWQTILNTSQEVIVTGKDITGQKTTSRQLFFLKLPTKWFEVKNCELCFPNNPQDETILLVTDKTAVTPILIFDTPRGRKTLDTSKFHVSPEVLMSGHYAIDHNHYLYYIDKGMFFKQNKDLVTEWLKTLKLNPLLKYTGQESYIIIAPNNDSNSSFIHLVNQTLFENSAVVIHYDPTYDHIQNFSIFYNDIINSSINKPKIVFVDDTMVAGSTFIKTNYFLKHTRVSEIADKSGFDACVILLDRSSFYVYENVTRKLKEKEEAFFSYAKLHLSSISAIDNSCPLCQERDRFSQIAEGAFLDKMKLYFLQQARKMRIQNHYNLVTGDVNDIRHLRRVEAIHRTYYWFSQNYTSSTTQFENYQYLDDWKKDLLQTPSPFIKTYLEDLPNEEINETLLRILTQSPLTHYKPVKTTVFRWVLTELRRLVLKLTENHPALENYYQFRKLKFLTRRASLMSCNYLISDEYFIMLKNIYDSSDTQIMLSFNRGTHITIGNKKSINSFNVFFAAQIKEIIFLNETRSIKLEEKLVTFGAQPATKAFHQLIRINREENGVLMHNFTKYLSGQIEEMLPIFESTENELIRAILERDTIQNHPSFSALQDFWAVTDKDNSAPSNILDDQSFLSYIYASLYLDYENNIRYPLSRKTNLLMYKIAQIICGENDESGSMLAVNFNGKQGAPELFFPHNTGRYGGLREFSSTDSHNFLSKFLGGEKDRTESSFKTVIEWQKIDGKWIDLYATDMSSQEKSLDSIVPNPYNRILVLRINKRSFTTDSYEDILDNGQALLCFFMNAHYTAPTEVSKVRYLLLLKQKLSHFIENHHETNEFRDWISADEKKRTALLTGHGRDMLIKISGDRLHQQFFRNILSTLLITQRYIIDIKEHNVFGLDKTKSYIREYTSYFMSEFNVINKVNFESVISKMGLLIFSDMDIVENKEDVIISPVKDFEPFSFYRSILTMIFFELLINAKKNRYIFLPGEKIDIGENDLLDRNRITFSIDSSAADVATIVMTNTTVSVIPLVSKKLESTSRRVKDSKDISGIELIHTLLTDFSLGSIEFRSSTINERHHLAIFTAILSLNKQNIN